MWRRRNRSISPGCDRSSELWDGPAGVEPHALGRRAAGRDRRAGATSTGASARRSRSRRPLPRGPRHVLALQTRPYGVPRKSASRIADRLIERQLRRLNPALVTLYRERVAAVRARRRRHRQALADTRTPGRRTSWACGRAAGTPVVGQLERRSPVLAAAAADAERLVEQALRLGGGRRTGAHRLTALSPGSALEHYHDAIDVLLGELHEKKRQPSVQRFDVALGRCLVEAGVGQAGVSPCRWPRDSNPLHTLRIAHRQVAVGVGEAPAALLRLPRIRLRAFPAGVARRRTRLPVRPARSCRRTRRPAPCWRRAPARP